MEFVDRALAVEGFLRERMSESSIMLLLMASLIFLTVSNLSSGSLDPKTKLPYYEGLNINIKEALLDTLLP